MNIVDYQIESQIFKLQKYVLENRYKEIVFVCVGNYKIWYDSFAPQFAESLRESNINCYVYGGKNSIVPDNLIDYMTFIETKHARALIIVVDSCLVTDDRNSCCFFVKKSPMVPAGYTNTKSFGDISILFGVTRKENKFKYLETQKQTIKYLINRIGQCLRDNLYKKSIFRQKITI